MLLRRRSHPQWLIAAGLLGMVLYTAGLRAGSTARHASDLARGAWAGACIGLLLVGVTLLARARVRPGRRP